jgi:phage terminase large subunit GpA-like protein
MLKKDFKPQDGYTQPCPHCGAVFQVPLVNEDGYVYLYSIPSFSVRERDQQAEQGELVAHQQICTAENPFINDPNAFYFQKDGNGQFIEPVSCYTEVCEY